jgi:transaldolase
MNATHVLHDLGQSLWLDNITRTLLDSGTLARYVRDFAVTGLTSNPTIFEHAICDSNAYDEAIRAKGREGKSGEKLFFELALEDLRRAADLFRPVFEATGGVDGWVSLEVSPLLAHDAALTIAAAAELHARAARPNLFIKIPGTAQGLAAIEASIFAGVPVNVTLLFSRAQVESAAEAYLRGIERRIAAGLDPRVGSVASLFVSRWDVAVHKPMASPLDNRLGIAVAQRAYRSYREWLTTPAPSGSGRRARAAPAVGQYRDQGSEGARHAVCRATGRTRHHQHDAREDPARVRRPWPARARPGDHGHRRRGPDRRVPRAGHRRGCACRALATRRRR